MCYRPATKPHRINRHSTSCARPLTVRFVSVGIRSLEHGDSTCFCAIDPARRPEYVELVRAILKPGGWLLACFFPVGEGTGGPPFSATRDEVRRLFTPAFACVESYVPTTSAPGRQGREWMVSARVRPG